MCISRMKIHRSPCPGLTLQLYSKSLCFQHCFDRYTLRKADTEFFLCHATSRAVYQIHVLPGWCLSCKIPHPLHPLPYNPQSSHISPAIASSLNILHVFSGLLWLTGEKTTLILTISGHQEHHSHPPGSFPVPCCFFSLCLPLKAAVAAYHLSSSPPVPFTVQQFSSAVWSSDLDTVFFLLVLVDTLIFSLPLWKLTEHLLSKPILISSGSGRGSRPRRLWELPGCLVSAFRLHQLENDRGSHSCTSEHQPLALSW